MRSEYIWIIMSADISPSLQNLTDWDLSENRPQKIWNFSQRYKSYEIKFLNIFFLIERLKSAIDLYLTALSHLVL